MMSDNLPTLADKEMSDIQKHAWKWAIGLAGTLLVLSMTANMLGFRRVVEAYADSLVWKIKQQQTCVVEPNELLETFKIEVNNRFLPLEKNSHTKGK